ncbi:MAG: hypothetical protein OXF64_04480 [bacterium]|nr:hypothetical protein [bacterium]MCY4272064.1 hypothetical protein [bacterium]
MRCVITANDEQGRSFVAREIEIGSGVTDVFAIDDVASLAPLADVVDWGDEMPVPGGVRWLFSRVAPGQCWEMHATPTIDLDVIIEGEMDLILDSGTVTLRAGDSALVTGRHGSRGGPDGCLMSIILLGIGG